MRFEDAIKLVRGGHFVTRTSWGDQGRYVRMADSGEQLRYVSTVDHDEEDFRSSMNYYPTQDDMVVAGDWEIVRVQVVR